MIHTISIPGTDLASSAIALGALAWGSKITGDAVDRLYDTYRAAGGTFFDTAHIYAGWLPNGLGASERALGEIVRRRRDRANIIIASKGGHPDAGSWYRRPDRYLSPERVDMDITESLDRLGDSMIDLYFLHRDDSRVPVGEIIDLLNEQIARGRIRYAGASNWTAGRIAAANEYAAAKGKRGFVASQPMYSLAEPNPPRDKTMRSLEAEDRVWHARSRLPVLAYSCTANGYFASNGEKGATAWDNPVSRARLGVVKQLAAELGVTPNQIALAYLMHQQFPVVPILGTVDVNHLRDGLGAASVRLSPDQVHRLEIGV
jgi:aryl-alcohol dehydrogenase-like predicted oxidoreductase